MESSSLAQTKDNKYIPCCYCGKTVPLNGDTLFPHLTKCSSSCIILQKKYPKFYTDVFKTSPTSKDKISIISKKAIEFYKHLNYFMNQYSKESVNVNLIPLLKKVIKGYNAEEDIENASLSIKCVKCLKTRYLFEFPSHIMSCFINQLNSTIPTERVFTFMLIEILLIISKSLYDNKLYLKFLIKQMDNYLPLISNDEIFCFICGAMISLRSFEIHHSQCIKAYTKKKSLTEPNSLAKILANLAEDKDIDIDDLKSYAIQARTLYNDLLKTRCVRCGKNFSPHIYDDHIDKCGKKAKTERSDMLTSNINKPQLRTLKNRKSSMEHLKTITNEEIKNFHLIKVNIIPFSRRSSRKLQADSSF